MPGGYYRFPTLQQNTVVFVCEDDLWSVASEGGIARRLTSNLGEVTRPLLSPDGSAAGLCRARRRPCRNVCHAGAGRAGPAPDLPGRHCLCQHLAGPDGQDPLRQQRRALVPALHPPVHESTRPGRAHRRTAALRPGAQRSPLGPAAGWSLGRNTDDPARWKRYRGGTAGQLWIDLKGSGKFKPLLKLDGNLTSPMWLADAASPQGRIYFISDHEGIGNLYSCLPSGEDLRRHTAPPDFYARNASTRWQAHRLSRRRRPVSLRPTGQGLAAHRDRPSFAADQRNRKFVSAAALPGTTACTPRPGPGHRRPRQGVHLCQLGRRRGAAQSQPGSGHRRRGGPRGQTPTGVRYRLPALAGRWQTTGGGLGRRRRRNLRDLQRRWR